MRLHYFNALPCFDQLVRRCYPDIKINHVHHAGNSSGVVDGAAGLLLASPQYAKAQGWTVAYWQQDVSGKWVKRA